MKRNRIFHEAQGEVSTARTKRRKTSKLVFKGDEKKIFRLTARAAKPSKKKHQMK